jgi:hypothetical protein
MKRSLFTTKNCMFSLIYGLRNCNKCSNIMGYGHTKERLCTGEIGQEKDTKNLNVVDVPIVQE